MRTAISGGPDNIDDAITKWSPLGFNLIVLGDFGSSHNLRTWLLTKGRAYDYCTGTYAVIPGFTWTGNIDEPSVAALGTLGFCCQDEGYPSTPASPFVNCSDPYQYIAMAAYGNHLGGGSDDSDKGIDDDLAYIKQRLDALVLANPSVPVSVFLNPIIGLMDGVFTAGDEAGKSKIHGISYELQPPPCYRTKAIKTLKSLASWVTGAKGGTVGVSAPPVSGICLFTSGGDVSSFKQKYDENANLRDILAACNATASDLSISDTLYKNALGGGWKVMPVFCSNTSPPPGKIPYTGMWLDKTYMDAIPTPPQPRDPYIIIYALSNLMTHMRTTRRIYVSDFYNTTQESSLKLEMNDLYGNRIAAMGDAIDPPSGAKLRLTVDYQNLTPKENLFLESAALVVIYDYNNGQPHAKEVSFTGLHNPMRNYIFTKHSGKEVKIRTFSRIFDNFQAIRAVYGKITYSEPNDTTIKDINDYYGVIKHGAAQKAHTAFTAPIWVRRN